MAEDERRLRVLQKLKRELGPIVMEALDDPKTIEVCLNTDGSVWVEKLGQPMAKKGVMTRANAESMLATLASALDTVITAEKPILEGELPLYGARFEGVIAPIVSFPSFAIRKKATMIYTLDDYVTQGVMTEMQREILRHTVEDRLNILVVGGTGTVKTTLTNALIHVMNDLTPDHRILIMEDTPEIQCSADNQVILRTSTNVTMRMLLRVCMRMRPDRILVGEVRGGEALDLLRAWGTGHPGGIATTHANNAVAGLTRLEGLIAEVSQSPMQALIADAVNIVVGIVKRGGRRFLEGIYRVEGYDMNAKRYLTSEIVGYDSVTPELDPLSPVENEAALREVRSTGWRYLKRTNGQGAHTFPSVTVDVLPSLTTRQHIAIARAN